VIAYCPTSNFRAPAEFSPLRCPVSGQPLEYSDLPRFDPAVIDSGQPGQWRYRAMMPVVDETAAPITLGEGWTPLLADHWHGLPVCWKLDSLMPTGSYKDRGVSAMVTWFARQGFSVLMDDTSGNAGASLACYAARAGILARIFVPASAPEPKKAQIVIYGAELIEVPGPRSGATEAVEAAQAPDIGYASHAWHPAFLLGQMTVAWEIWEQLQGAAPDWLVGPAGQGGMMLGAWRGFQQLFRAGLIQRLPRLAVVQAEPYTPIVEAVRARQEQVSFRPHTGTTVADGISVARPVRGNALLRAINHSMGTAIAVTDAELLAAHVELAEQGIFVEPTSAVVGAALDKLRPQIEPGQSVVAIITGNGLKKPPAL